MLNLERIFSMFSRIIGETPKEYDTPEQAIIEGALDVLNSNDPEFILLVLA